MNEEKSKHSTTDDTLQPLVTPARSHERTYDNDESKNTSGSGVGGGEQKLVTAISRVELSEPMNEEVIDRYSTLVRRIMNEMNKNGHDSLNYFEFKMALSLANVEVLESRAIALYEVTALKKNNLMDQTDFEIALMINDTYPVHSSYVSIFELFSTFDVDRDGMIDFEQFKECVNTLSHEERSNPKDSAFLAYLFRKNAQEGKMKFNTFVTVWCTKIADVKHVLDRRGLLKQKRSRDTLRRISGFFSSVWRYFQLKDILQQEMTKPGYDIIFQFEEVRQRIVDLRIELHRKKDKEKRNSKITTRKQKRKGAITASKHRRQVSLLIQNESGKTQMMIDENRIMREKIMKDCEDAELQIDLEYHRNKQEKLNQEALEVQLTSADRLILCNQDLTKIPTKLYSSQESRLKLSDVKILDLSQNSIMELPDTGFLFHLSSLRKLCLSRNNLQKIPDEVSCLVNLEILKVEQNHLMTIPATLGSLKSLQILDVSNNNLSNLHQELFGMSSLKILKLHSNRIMELPSTMGSMKNLQSINFSCNQIAHLPDSFCSSSNLVHVDVSNNSLEELPFHFGNLDKLEDLDISYNCLSQLPGSFTKLKRLRQFNARYNNFFEWGDCMQGLQNLESLECMNNVCTRISKNIGYLTSLQRFSSPVNHLKVLPPEIGLLKLLLYLDLHNNQIEHLPVEIGALSNLEYLDVSQNIISSFPHEFCLMKSLMSLNASHNNLQNLPQYVGSLRNLRILNVASNELVCLPLSFENLSNLEELDASYNKMDSISKGFCKNLTSLKVANFHSNSIQHLPIQICFMSSLQVLNVRQNKLNSLPLELMDAQITLDISQNPLNDLPFKFNSSIETHLKSENPSGYNQHEVFEWMKNEQRLYQPAVEEWNLKSTSYLSDILGFEDFRNGVIWRCDNVLDGFDSSIFKNDLGMIKRLTQFYFHCKKYGNPPLYVHRDAQKETERVRDATELRIRREKRMDVARNSDLKRREEEYQRYFGNLHERCIDAELRFKSQLDIILEQKRVENRILMNDVSARMTEKDMIEAQEKLKQERERALETEKLNAISFKMFKSKKRFLPIEIEPCWKSHNE